jgi:hypothetical protein
MNKKDLSNLSKIYIEQVIEEININPESDFGDREDGKFGRYKGRHFKKPPIPQSRKNYVGSSEKETDLFSGSEYPEIYGNEEEEDESVSLNTLSSIDLNKLQKDERREYIIRMAVLRSEIDELKNESQQIAALSVNRSLMDEILFKLVSNFGKGNMSLKYVANNGDPIFSTDSEHIQVSIPLGSRTNPEDVTIKKVNI